MATKRKKAAKASARGKRGDASPRDALLAKLRSRYGEGRARLALEGSASDVPWVLPTGVAVLDLWVFGIGGFPGGRMVEVYGDASAGKTSFALQLLGRAQAEGGLAVLVETERALDRRRFKAFGVDEAELILFEPDTMEEVLEALADILADAPPRSLVVWDSLAGTRVEDERVGGRARLTSRHLPKLMSLCARNEVGLLVVNQIRDKVGVAFGDTTTTPGGHAPKFHATVRLQLWRGGGFKEDGELAGISPTFKATKNKLARPHRKARARLSFERGWDDGWTLLEWAKDQGVVGPRARGKAALEKARAALLDAARPTLLVDPETVFPGAAPEEAEEAEPAEPASGELEDLESLVALGGDAQEEVAP